MIDGINAVLGRVIGISMRNRSGPVVNSCFGIIEKIKRRANSNENEEAQHQERVRMRLLIIDPFRGFNGPARFCSNVFCSSIPERSAVLILKRPANCAENTERMDDMLRARGCKIRLISNTGMTPAMGNLRGWLRFPLDFALAAISVLRAARAFRPTIVFVNTELNLLGGWIARLLRVPCLARVNAQTLGQHGWWGRLYARIFGHSFNIALCNSLSTVYYLESLGVSPVTLAVLENGFDRKCFHPRPPSAEVRHALGATSTHFLVICVAHHSPIKGVHVLLEAFETFAYQHPNVHLAIIGQLVTNTQKAYSDSLYTKVRGSPTLSERVTFHAPSDQIHLILPQADVLVQPSLSEAFGRVVVEAASCGIPVIASDIGGLKETVVAGRTGWLVPPGDAVALAGALSEAYLSPVIRRIRGRAGIKHSAKYSVENMRNKFFSICSSLETRRKR